MARRGACGRSSSPRVKGHPATWGPPVPHRQHRSVLVTVLQRSLLELAQPRKAAVAAADLLSHPMPPSCAEAGGRHPPLTPPATRRWTRPLGVSEGTSPLQGLPLGLPFKQLGEWRPQQEVRADPVPASSQRRWKRKLGFLAWVPPPLPVLPHPASHPLGSGGHPDDPSPVPEPPPREQGQGRDRGGAGVGQGWHQQYSPPPRPRTGVSCLPSPSPTPGQPFLWLLS